eukprot:866036-Rhodomonas_salina.2
MSVPDIVDSLKQSDGSSVGTLPIRREEDVERLHVAVDDVLAPCAVSACEERAWESLGDVHPDMASPTCVAGSLA